MIKLAEMLTWRRPAGSRTERAFLRAYLPRAAVQDHYRNWHVTIGDAPILWSCHTDTVHRHGGRQAVARVGAALSLAPGQQQSHCLGADDTVGVWLCLEMIAAGVPGHYIFHYGEEHGGIGSRALAHAPAWAEHLSRYRACIALDRAGYHDIITHQAGGRCCSDRFAESLGAALGAADAQLDYRPSSHGVYTDSAEYTDLIGECTNLSVGYFAQHSPLERVDTAHVYRLRDALCTADWSGLAYERLPGAEDDIWPSWSSLVGDDAIDWQWARTMREQYEWDDGGPDRPYCHYCDNGGCLYCQ